MKLNFLKLIAFGLFVLMVLTACGPASVPNESDTADTDEPTMTDAAMTEEITTDAAMTEELTTEVTTTEAVTTEPTTTGTPVKEEKKVKNILMIGSSFCYYYVEELCGIAKADG